MIHGNQTTSRDAAEFSANISQASSYGKPEFIRLPHPGQQCFLTGMSRSGLNALILPTPENNFKPPVRSFCLRKRGARTGIRLIDYDALVNYIRSHEDCVAAAGSEVVAAKGAQVVR
jgi:hypothetical protein